MNVGVIYQIMALTSMLEICLILNRTLATEYKETIDRPFCKMLTFFAFFCLVDSFWGMCDSGVYFRSQLVFTIIGYGYHTMAVFSAFVWFGYVIAHTKAAGMEKFVMSAFRYTLLVVQLTLIVTNLFTHEAFFVDNGGDYHMGSLRLYIYLLQFSYYFILIVYGIFKFAFAKGAKKAYREVIIFSLVPLIFGIGQYLFYDVAMYSIGFVVSAFIIFAFNITSQREGFLAERYALLDEKMNQAKERESKLRDQTMQLSVDLYMDALTGLYNRRAYEDDIIKYASGDREKDLVYFSMDLTGLKNVNDAFGHDAGDELIRGAAFCINMCLGSYGKTYRVGGDEFVAIIFADEKKLKEIINDFEKTMNSWKGKYVNELVIAYGYVVQTELGNVSIREYAKIADSRMYESKELYYATRGINRRGRQEAYDAVCNSYTKILKVNLTRDTYSIIKLDEQEMDVNKGFSNSISEWLRGFAMAGQVHEDDREIYLRKTDLIYLQEYFKSRKSLFCVYYKRMIGTTFKKAMLEMIPAKEYTDEEQIVFLYVKNIDR